nr:hypothetical protein [Tanacetum cinerariifolium]
MKEMMQLVPVEDVYVQSLQVKHPIINRKVHTEGQRSYWQIIRLGGSSACYQFFVDLLKQLDREDLNQLWALVKEYLSIRPASSEKEIELWVELKRMYEPDPEDQLRIVGNKMHKAFLLPGPVWGCDRLVIRAKVIENQIMAASAIAISSDSSDESMGSPPSRVILFGDIPTVIPSTSMIAPETSAIAPDISSAAPVVETTIVASPTGLCGLVPYLDSDSDSPDEMASPEVTTHSSSSSSNFPIAPVTASPETRRRAESSLGDSSERPLHSSSNSARLSRKRCRSPVDYVPSSTPVTGSLAPTHSYSPETSMEEDTEIDTIEIKDGRELDIIDRNNARDHVEIDPRDVRDDTEEYEANTSAGDTVEVGIDPMSAPVADEESEELAGEDSSNSPGTRDGIL